MPQVEPRLITHKLTRSGHETELKPDSLGIHEIFCLTSFDTDMTIFMSPREKSLDQLMVREKKVPVFPDVSFHGDVSL